MDGINATINFTTRPASWVGLTARYRYNDRKDRMPEFDVGHTVRFDGVPEPGPYMTEHHNATGARRTSTRRSRRCPTPRSRSGRARTSTSTRRGRLDADRHVGSGVDRHGRQPVRAAARDDRAHAQGRHGLQRSGHHRTRRPGDCRDFEDAERTRDRDTLLVTVTPVSILDVTASYAFGKDVYDEAEQELGLLDNKNTAVNVGVNVTPSEKVAFGVNYGQDKFHAFQRSRTANPFSGVAGAYESWTDVNRDWT